MSTTRENHHLLPNAFHTAPLETWADAIQRRLSSEAKQCLLEKVEHYKALSDTEHDFLVFYASHPSGSKIVLGADRNARSIATATSKQTSGSTSQDMDTTHPSTVASSEEELSLESLHLAYDGVQVSHDGTPAPILAQHGPCVPLYTITFSSTSPPLTASTSTSTSSSSSNPEARGLPSVLHLSVLLITIRTRFTSHAILEFQCYFFARVTCLALIDHFGGVETELDEDERGETERVVHVVAYSAGVLTLQKMLPAVASPVLQRMLPVVMFPALQGMSPVVAACVFIPALPSLPWVIASAGVVVGGYGVVILGRGAVKLGYSAVGLYRRIMAKSKVDRLQISDQRMRQHAITDLYREAWNSFELQMLGTAE